LFVVEIKNRKAGTFEIVCEEERVFVGNGKSSTIRLKGWNIAEKQACFYDCADGVHILDLHKNSVGIAVNGKTVSEYGPILVNDIVEIGGNKLSIKEHFHGKQDEIEPVVSEVVQLEPSVEPQKVRNDALLNSNDENMASYSKKSGENSKKSIKERANKALREKLHEDLLARMDLRRISIKDMDDDEVSVLTEKILNQLVGEYEDLPDDLDKTELVKLVLDEAIGLGPLEDLISDDTVSEIMVNCADEIFYEKEGKLEQSEISFTNDRAVTYAIERIVSPLGRRIDEGSPMVDARLKDGSRVNAVIPPLALKGPNITIRKFIKDKLTSKHLLNFGSVNQQMIDFIELVVKNKQNVIVSGGTGSGKTTLLNICSNYIPDNERIITVEDAAELMLYQPNLISLEARPPNQEGNGAVDIRDLVKNCLRMRPDRIIVGECRGGEALDMLQAMNTGHDGSLTTAHANSPRDCISRIEVMVMMSGIDLPVLAIREQISSAVQIIVQQSRFSCGSRKVTSICEVSGMENGIVQLGEIFKFVQSGVDSEGKVVGDFVATGLVPKVCDDLRSTGKTVDLSVFKRPEDLEIDIPKREVF